jgi:hypothetical protein
MLPSEEAWRTKYFYLVKGAKKHLVLKWFALEPEDISGIVDLQISKLYRIAKKNHAPDFVCTHAVICRLSERMIIKQILKNPSVERKWIKDEETGKRKKKIEFHGCSSLDVAVTGEDGEGTPLVEKLVSPCMNLYELLEAEEEWKWKKEKILEHMTERMFKQLMFEYENHCVTQEHQNFIQKIKEVIKNEKREQ